MKTTKDAGTCSRQIGQLSIIRTKYKSKADADTEFNILVDLEVINKNYVVFKCPECHLWHFGSKEWEKK